MRTLADRIKTRQRSLELSQYGVAERLRTNAYTKNNWRRTAQLIRYLVARIIEFTGYVPDLKPKEKDETLGQRIKRMRRALGIRQYELAFQLGVSPTTAVPQGGQRGLGAPGVWETD